MEELKVEQKKRPKIKITYGNRHKLIKDVKDDTKNKHEWTAFVSIEHPELKDADLIESVKFTLHETFRNPERIVKKTPFELKT
eukprot:CAMPEP_0168330174 /NCGR_PEP_ID=MMETSP0213-20121227/7557_1 /TAXON_ID=151035 /ORGANISM="Euplotes harpa, Strain FSP1.4" /LENGTH=82 /DNA_ID=CAMNT_0008333661 /DNA_START=262 /DNA_END=510 /DNA_ORIENTATION=+